MTFIEARAFMAKRFSEDADLRSIYVDNIAMLLHDRYDITGYEERNRAGDAIMRLIFEQP